MAMVRPKYDLVGSRALVVFRQQRLQHRDHVDVAIEMPSDPAGYARLLYAALHDLDDAACEVILADAVPDGPEWTGVRDRLRRAAEK